jgi:hypothetical protein
VSILRHIATAFSGQPNKQRRLDSLCPDVTFLLSIVLDRFIDERNAPGLPCLQGSPQLK